MANDLQATQLNLDLMLNDIAANQDVFTVLLQCFLTNSARNADPTFLDRLQGQVLNSLTPSIPGDSYEEMLGKKRGIELRRMKATALFDEVRVAVGLPLDRHDQAN